MRRRKLYSNRGETLIEVMASIVIATLSVALLFTCVTASGKIGDAAKKVDAEHYNALSEADAQAVPPGTVLPVENIVITGEDSKSNPQSTTAPVDVYGGKGTFSYKEK